LGVGREQAKAFLKEDIKTAKELVKQIYLKIKEKEAEE
jgi:hypothetical protein